MKRIERLGIIGLILIVLSATFLFFESTRVSEAQMDRVTAILKELRSKVVELEFAVATAELQKIDESSAAPRSIELSSDTTAGLIESHTEATSLSFSHFRSLRSLCLWIFLAGSFLILFGRYWSIRNRSN